MSSRVASSSQRRLRRSLLQLASLLLLTMLASGLLALFSVWSLNAAHIRNQRHLAEVAAMVDLGRTAQVRFKTQVQEWKNLLLRGADPAQRQTYEVAFHANEVEVHTLLRQMAGRGDPSVGFGLTAEVERIDAGHVALGLVYSAALASADPLHWDAPGLDRAMRGLDRPLNQQLDALAARLAAQTEPLINESMLAERARFDTLSRVLWLAMAVSIVLMGSLLWRAMSERTAEA